MLRNALLFVCLCDLGIITGAGWRVIPGGPGRWPDGWLVGSKGRDVSETRVIGESERKSGPCGEAGERCYVDAAGADGWAEG